MNRSFALCLSRLVHSRSTENQARDREQNMLGKAEMLRERCKEGGLFLTADLLVPDDPGDLPSDGYDMLVLKKIQNFQPIEDLVTALDSIASSAVAT